MRKLIVWNVMSLDGMFEGERPWELDFHMSVWGDELEAFSLAQGQEAGMLLFGRRTYQGMYDYWRKETGAVADMMNGIAKGVASRTLDSAEWNNTTLLAGEAAQTVQALKARDGKPIFVFGSADLLKTLLPAGLVDEYRLCLAPRLLGKGRPLFSPMAEAMKLTLLEARPLKTGGVLLRYGV